MPAALRPPSPDGPPPGRAPPPDLQADARVRIRGAGLRATGARVAVLRCLEAAGRPLSHAEVMAVLDDDTLDRATIYRNLSDLTEAGLLQRLDLGDHVWRFEPAAAGHAGGPAHHEGQHPHFVCTDCGAVQCLDDVQISLQGSSVPRSVAQASVRVQLSGRCDDCGDESGEALTP